MDASMDDRSDKISLIYIPCGSEEEAADIARTLLSERLIACGNIYSSKSLYTWKGDITDEQEYLLLCKTAPSRVEAAARRVAQLHSYDIPCILRFESVQANRSYASWVRESVGNLSAASSSKKGPEK